MVPPVREAREAPPRKACCPPLDAAAGSLRGGARVVVLLGTALLLTQPSSVDAAACCSALEEEPIGCCWAAKAGKTFAQLESEGMCLADTDPACQVASPPPPPPAPTNSPTAPPAVDWRLIGGYNTAPDCSEWGCTTTPNGTNLGPSVERCTEHTERMQGNAFALSGKECCPMFCSNPETATTKSRLKSNAYVLRAAAAPACVENWRLGRQHQTCTQVCSSYASQCDNAKFRAALASQSTRDAFNEMLALLTGFTGCNNYIFANTDWGDAPNLVWDEASEGPGWPEHPPTDCIVGNAASNQDTCNVYYNGPQSGPIYDQRRRPCYCTC